MFCSQCGTASDGAAVACAQCGIDLQRKAPASLNTERAVAASKDAARAVKLLLTDPVGSIGAAYDALSGRQPVDVGITFCAVFILSCVLGMRTVARSVSSGLVSVSIGVKEILQVALLAAVPAATIVAIFFGIHLAVRQEKSLPRALFAGGAALIPLALFNLAGGLLGPENWQVLALLALVALSYTILLLYAGCRDVLKASSAISAAAVPVIIVVTAWVTKIVAAAML
jgi:hypothetical protein